MTTRPRSPLQKRILASLRGLPLTAAGSAYLEQRGLLSVATDLGFGVVPDSPADNLRMFAGRLAIPSIGPRDNVYDVAFRCMAGHDCKETVLYTNKEGKPVTCKKYLFIPGMDKRLYNLQALAKAGDTIEVTEGQLDAATLVACGLHAVGVPGAHAWKDHHPRLFQGFSRVRVWADPDSAGRHFANTITGSMASADVMMVPWDHDVNSTFVEQGRDAILAIAEGQHEDDTAEASGWGLEPDAVDDPYDGYGPPPF